MRRALLLSLIILLSQPFVSATDTEGPILLKIVAILASNSFGLNGFDK